MVLPRRSHMNRSASSSDIAWCLTAGRNVIQLSICRAACTVHVFINTHRHRDKAVAFLDEHEKAGGTALRAIGRAPKGRCLAVGACLGALQQQGLLAQQPVAT